MKYRIGLIIVVFVALIASYFIFFFDPIKIEPETKKIINSMSKGEFSFKDNIDIIDIEVFSTNEGKNLYNYSINFDATKKLENIEIIIIPNNYSKVNNNVYADFGIRSNQGVSFNKYEDALLSESEVAGTILNFIKIKKVESFLIYIKANDTTHYIKVGA